MSRRFYALDVFTNTPLQGNPLAVILDSQDLNSTQMQTIAREFNLSETVFVSPPTDPTNTAKIRIFTPTKELPFAGHPTIGTAILLATLEAPDAMQGLGGITIALEYTAEKCERFSAQSIRQNKETEQNIGTVHVDVTKHKTLGVRAIFQAPKLSTRLDASFNLDHIAQALGILPSQIGFKNHVPSLWSAGVPFIMIPIKDLEVMANLKIPHPENWQKAFGDCGSDAVYIYTNETVNPNHHVHARMFSPLLGVPEDPATGSAAAAFAGVAVAFEQPPNGTHQLVIEQGYEMGRPSQIALDIDVMNGAATHIRIGGGAVIISEGKLHL
jgi:trans-2,3-dihydro-3-hydroxyanthranilate isomerase